MNRFDTPSLEEILKYPPGQLLWQAVNHNKQTIKSVVNFGKAAYMIILTLYKLTFRTKNECALILDGSFINDGTKYSIYKDRFPLIRTLMYAMDDYILYYRKRRLLINGITFGTAFAHSIGTNDNILKAMYKNLSDYYCAAQQCYIYEYNPSNLVIPYKFNLHFTQPLVVENSIDLQNNNVIVDTI